MKSARLLTAHANQTYARLIDAARDFEPVTGLTHNFYRYPARFSPKFVRVAIESFSEPGDLVLDPFMGGGTTLVEALALGRNAVGADISSLAAFVSEVKTTLFSEKELETLQRWSIRAASSIGVNKKSRLFSDYEEAGYYRHLDRASTWRLRKAIEQALATAVRLDDPRLEAFARCVALRTAQWALDGRETLPSIKEFRLALVRHTDDMIQGARSLCDVVGSRGTHHRVPLVRCLNRSTVGIETDAAIKDLPPPRLVLTSPPYPGIHVLYHRWQIEGGKETPAPFWIANKLDGSGSSYYTMGDRHYPELQTYFENLRTCLQSVARLCTKDTTVMQVVAFSEPSWQLPRYLSVANDVGLAEHFLADLRHAGDGRLWRSVPNRKWYADQKGKTNSSQEVVLFHRSGS
jgi:DNA methylase